MVALLPYAVAYAGRRRDTPREGRTFTRDHTRNAYARMSTQSTSRSSVAHLSCTLYRFTDTAHPHTSKAVHTART
eukprot:8256534-Pyramimonas_sp.AAC.1